MNEIKLLLKQGKKVSEVARELGIDRKTVRKYRNRDIAQIAHEREAGQTRKRNLDDFEPWIRAKVKRMAEDGVINAESIYNELKKLRYEGSSRSVRRFVETLRPASRPSRDYRRFETPPGHQAMVDLGEKRGVRISGGRQTVYFIAMVLSRSRRKYVEWFERPIDTEMLLRFHESAFGYFEGVPRQMVYDQMKLAVLEERYGEVEFNQAFYSYAQWRHLEVYVCHKADPETKGKIESVVRYVKRGFLPGREFQSFGDLLRQWEEWVRDVADVKPHGTTGRPPLEAWREEKTALRPVPDEPVLIGPAYRIQLVQIDNWVKVLGNAYEIPRGHQAKEVKVRVTEERVEFRDLEGKHIYSHWRCGAHGKRIQLPEADRPAPKDTGEELTERVLAVLPCPEWIEAVRRKFPRHYRDQCRGVLTLARKTDGAILLKAARRLLDHRCVGYGMLKKTVAYLEDLAAPAEAAARVSPGELPGDLGLEPRSVEYYDQVMEVTR